MLDRLTEPLLARIGRSHSKAWSRSLRIGFVVALTTPVIAFAASQAIASGDDASGPSVQYQEAASHAAPRTTMRYDRARVSLDRHATYIVAAFVAGAAR